MEFSAATPKNPILIIACSMLCLSLIVLPRFTAGQEKKEQEKKEQEKKEQKKTQEQKAQEQTVKITEEILVVGKAPKEQPVSTVTRIDFTKLEQNKPLDLSEAIRYAPGVNVTFGDKDTYTLKLRGIDAKRIALLIDGVPDYEPYYSTFDLKTVSAAGIESLQITKGPSSVLYGPNTLGGIVNVITRRPGPVPYLTLNGSYGEENTRSVGADGGFQWKSFSLVGDVSYQDSDAFMYPDKAAALGVTTRKNSDYQRLNLNAKVYYQPSARTEIMVNGGVYLSDYGMPAALFTQKARYWRFKDWDRYTLNAGGFTALGENSTLRFRAFYVNYNNTLDQWKDVAMTIRQFESTFDNSVYGAFALGDFYVSRSNSLKVSLNYEKDIARTQDDVNFPWLKYDQGTFSAAVEDHFSITDQWKLVGGVSLDTIYKFKGGTSSKFNPLIGIKFSPQEDLDFHVSVSQKSKFPSMRSLYSTSSGNPNLLSETGTCGEAGFVLNKGVYVSGAAFTYQFKNMIDTKLLADGTRLYWNIGKARINGFELQAQKSFGWLEATVNYTFLDHKNVSDDRPLDALAKHNLNFEINIFPIKALRVGFNGLYASASNWYDFNAQTLLGIPEYKYFNLIVSCLLDRYELFIKITNLFDAYFYSEPGFPWRGRFFELGAKVNIL